LRACPEIADHARAEISGWYDLVETENLVRAAVVVSPDAWIQACEVMGDTDALIVIAAFLQGGDAISSAGEKCRAAQSIVPVLMALRLVE